MRYNRPDSRCDCATHGSLLRVEGRGHPGSGQGRRGRAGAQMWSEVVFTFCPLAASRHAPGVRQGTLQTPGMPHAHPRPGITTHTPQGPF